MQNLTSLSCLADFNLNETAKRLCFDCSVFAKLSMDVLSMLQISCAMTNDK